MKNANSNKSANNTFARQKNKTLNTVNRSLLFLSITNFFLIIYDLGFTHQPQTHYYLNILYSGSLVVFWLLFLLRLLILRKEPPSKGARLTDYVIFIIISLVVIARFFLTAWITSYLPFITSVLLLHILFISVFLIELSKVSLAFYSIQFNPAVLYVGSFFVMIIIGTGLLLLPNATVEGISVIDAFFTATSAVCVTGLIVVDTATAFTTSGKTIILLLIQVGGLGVMTLSSFFGFFFKGAYSYKSQLFLKDFVNEDKLGMIFRTIFKVIFFTLSFELIGAFFIYYTLPENFSPTVTEKIQFSVFHSISAFCNAGFSTLSDGLYDSNVRSQYNFQLVIITLILFGGIGFPVIFNCFKYIRHFLKSRLGRYISKIHDLHDPRVLNINTKLVLVTSLALLLVGFIQYFITEQQHTLENRSAYGKVITALFGSVTPRTAGFNTVDMTELGIPTILVYLLLMWIGASPGSTGGGIKTTTFAVAILNTISVAKVKDRLEVFKREIPSESVQRAFSVMLLSFLVIGIAVFLLSYFDPQLGMIQIAFECFSAYSTVGLSLGITGDLSSASKLTIIVTMFLGRVGTLTLLVGFIRNIRSLHYRYPSENVFIS